MAKAVAITNHALRGIKHLHDRNLIHFDIKPANLLFGQENFLKIADLNSSKEEGHINKVIAASHSIKLVMSRKRAVSSLEGVYFDFNHAKYNNKRIWETCQAS